MENSQAANAQLTTLMLVAAWVIVGFMAALCFIILYKMIRGGANGIDLSYLISEENGQASLSRFQFLVFTFVIAIGLLVVILDKKSLPNIDGDVFVLLGISAGSYVTSKITQKTAKK